MRVKDADCLKIEKIGQGIRAAYLNKEAAERVIFGLGRKIASMDGSEGLWKEDHAIALLKDDGQLVAYCWVALERFCDGSSEHVIGHVYTEEGFRGQGYGRLLLGYVKERHGVASVAGPSGIFLNFARKHPELGLSFLFSIPESFVYPQALRNPHGAMQIFLKFEKPDEYEACESEWEEKQDEIIGMLRKSGGSPVEGLREARSRVRAFLEKYRAWIYPRDSLE